MKAQIYALTLGAFLFSQSASAVVLFSDTFERADSLDLNESTDGKSGSLGALNWGSNTFESLIEISNNALQIDNDNSDGNDGSWAWVENNFTGLTEFTVTMNILQQSSGGNGRYTGFRVGQTLDDISGESNAAIGGNAADVQIYLDNIGSTRGIRIYEGSTDLGYVTSSATSLPEDLTATFTFADMNAGTTLNYEVFLGEDSQYVGSTTWSGTDENYISLQSNTTSDTRIGSFVVEGTPVGGGGGTLGDYNGDGDVDLADYTLWRNNLGEDRSVLPAGSTSTGTGAIDSTDYDTWRANYDATGGIGLIASVPEPSSIAIVAAATCLLMLYRKRV